MRGSVFCAMNTISRTKTMALATTANHRPLVREPRSGSVVVVGSTGSTFVGSDCASGRASLSLM